MREYWRAAAVFGFFLVLGGGCDSLDTGSGAGSVQSASKSADDEGKDKSKVAGAVKERKAGGAESPDAEVAAAAPARDNEKVHKALGEYRECVLDCLDDKDVKETDQETCKLTCRTNAEAAGVDPDTPVIKIADRFDLCTSECYDPKMKETDRETCKLNCAAVAESLQATLEFATPTPSADDTSTVPQGCALSCMHQTSKCERLCGEQAGVETDRETCRLLCDSNGEICLDTCNINAAKSK